MPSTHHIHTSPVPTPALPRHPPHRIPRQPHRQTKDDHMTTHTTQAHRPSIKSGRHLIILQVNINGNEYKLEEIKLLIHNTHADITTIQETKLTLKQNFPQYITSPPFAPIGRIGEIESKLITLVRDIITFTTTDKDLYTSSRQHFHALQNS